MYNKLKRVKEEFSMSLISLDIDIPQKWFHSPQGTRIEALNNIKLTVKQGEFITIIGPSGCGKSTLLKIIAGLDTDHEGIVFLEQKQVIKPGIDKGFIFQEHRLFPWLTVEKNIAADLSLSD